MSLEPVFATVLAVCVGYLLGRWHAALVSVQHERERAFAALANLPDWEIQARDLERRAHQYDVQGMPYSASNMRLTADRRRRQGRGRDG